MSGTLALKSYSVSIQVERGPACYGRVKRCGRVFYRNYRRPVRGGVTFVDLLDEKMRIARQTNLDMLSRRLFGGAE